MTNVNKFTDFNDFITSYNKHSANDNIYIDNQVGEVAYTTFTTGEASTLHFFNPLEGELDSFEYTKLPLLFQLGLEKNWPGNYDIRVTVIEPVKNIYLIDDLQFMPEQTFNIANVSEPALNVLKGFLDYYAYSSPEIEKLYVEYNMR